jgi:hypothetical protein
MQLRHRTTLLVAVSLMFSARILTAQNADPSGHWEGAIKVPNQPISIQIDLAAKANGDRRATFTGVNIKGYPLSDVAVEGSSVRFRLKVDDGGVFSGKIGDDGQSIEGDFTSSTGSYTIPFSLTRSGDAKFDVPAKSPAIGMELEGGWEGALEVNGMTMRITLKLANQPDGMSRGSLANLDQGGVEIPVTAINQAASTVNIDVKVVNGSYTGALNAAGTELTGTWTQGTFSAPLTFHRATVGKN